MILTAVSRVGVAKRSDDSCLASVGSHRQCEGLRNDKQTEAYERLPVTPAHRVVSEIGERGSSGGIAQVRAPDRYEHITVLYDTVTISDWYWEQVWSCA